MFAACQSKFLCLQVYAEKYAEDMDAFFKDYAEAHAKLSNLGAKFDPPEVCQPQPCTSFPIQEDYFYYLGFIALYKLSNLGAKLFVV